MQLQLASSMFGCHAHVVHEDKTWDLGYIEDAELAGKFRQRLHGDVWMWRNPRCNLRELRDILVSLEHAGDQFSVRLRAVENSDDFYAILAVNNELVARTLAWKTMQHWQKWSRQEETQYLREQRVKFEPKVSADGKTVKVRVKVSNLGD
jgi:hypothetical protein